MIVLSADNHSSAVSLAIHNSRMAKSIDTTVDPNTINEEHKELTVGEYDPDIQRFLTELDDLSPLSTSEQFNICHSETISSVINQTINRLPTTSTLSPINNNRSFNNDNVQSRMINDTDDEKQSHISQTNSATNQTTHCHNSLSNQTMFQPRLFGFTCDTQHLLNQLNNSLAPTSMNEQRVVWQSHTSTVQTLPSATIIPCLSTQSQQLQRPIITQSQVRFDTHVMVVQGLNDRSDEDKF